MSKATKKQRIECFMAWWKRYIQPTLPPKQDYE